MRPTILVLVAASALSAMAGSCTSGLSYCGRSLLHIGNYINQIERAIADAHTDPEHFMDTLFHCMFSNDGEIKVQKDCGPGKCHDSGAGKSDYCVSGMRFALVEQYAE
ncbi:Maltose permease [Mycena venus]|uniref:Maltose permease n=1 Tax=Mycena venus TaxID=2733690 RepID=A0A8H6YVA0_9AGAR|nr:Maltose permease [Mycena venus]